MNLIELKSIGHYFDRDNNCLYPIIAAKTEFSDGEADTDNAIPVEDVDRDNGISDEDWETISK
jgi:hypothetical protein